MSGTGEELHEIESWAALIWEFYVPKRARYLTELYAFLHDAVRQEPMIERPSEAAAIRLEGFSVYEVDGAYRGEKVVWEERVLVVRLVFPRTATAPRIRIMGRHLLRITGFEEEEVWIIQYTGCKVYPFKGLSA